MAIDFDKIRREYPLPEIAAASGLKLERDGKEFKACCPFHGDKTPSFSIFPSRQKHWLYQCFGCGAAGDVIDFYQERYGCKDATQAVKELTGDDRREPREAVTYQAVVNPYESYDIARPPAKTPAILAGERTPPLLNPKRVVDGRPKLTTYKPTMVFPYRTKDGALIGYVLRVEIEGKKLTPGIWWMKNQVTGFEGWSHGSYPAPRPLYGLPELYANPDHQVLIVEGEKCKDAAKEALAGKKVVPISWMGGGKSISKTYWKSLKGRSVIIWPDNDAEGWRTALGYRDAQGNWHKGVIEYAYDAGAKRVKIIHITPDSRPPGWDIADAWHGTKEADYRDKLDQRAIELIMRDRIQDWPLKRFNEWKEKQDGIADTDTTTAAAEADNGSDRSDGGNTAGDRGHDEDRSALSTGAVADGDTSERARPNRPRARGSEIDADNWRQHLIWKADGDGMKATSLQNIALTLQYDRRFAGIFAWNEFAKEVYVMRRPPWDMRGHNSDPNWTPRKLIEPDVTAAACWLEYAGLAPKSNDVGKVIQRVAQHNAHNPVVERFEELQWDGVSRLSGGDDSQCWLVEYLGALPTDINRVFGRKWLIGAVARAFQPGCKVDTMLVLEGEQGVRKSSALRILSDAVVPGVFTDEIADPNSKDAGLQMQGALIIEIAELDAFRRAEVSQIKAWLSRQIDRFRRPYGKITEEFPRSCIFAGTVNPVGGAGYLKDPSGARRFWPVAVGQIDLVRLRKDAPQLWAEAVEAYKQGEKWWLDGDEEKEDARKAQELRYEEDPYAEMIDKFIKHRTSVTTLEIMKECLEIPPERRNSIVNRRIVNHLHQRGWQRDVYQGVVAYKAPLETHLDV